MHIEITKSDVETRQAKNHQGESFKAHTQSAFAHMGETYPVPIQLPVANPTGYEPGNYLIASSSFYIDNYGQLRLKKRLELEPIDSVQS